MTKALTTKILSVAVLGMVITACNHDDNPSGVIQGFPGPVGHYANATNKICGDANPAACVDVSTCNYEGQAPATPVVKCNPATSFWGCLPAPNDLDTPEKALYNGLITYGAYYCTNGCNVAGYNGNYNSTCFQ